MTDAFWKHHKKVPTIPLGNNVEATVPIWWNYPKGEWHATNVLAGFLGCKGTYCEVEHAKEKISS